MDEQFRNYVWHDDKNQRNVEKHGISFQRAAVAMEEGRPVNGEPRDGDRQDAFVHLNGETIKVVCQKVGDNTRIITAHKNSDGHFDKEYDRLAAVQGVEKNTEHNKEFAAWRELDEKQKVKAKPFVKALENKQEIEREKALLSTERNPADKEKDIAALKEKHRQETIEARKPRLDHDAKERADLAAELQKQKERDLQAAKEQAKKAERKAALERRAEEAKKRMRELNDRERTR